MCLPVVLNTKNTGRLTCGVEVLEHDVCLSVVLRSRGMVCAYLWCRSQLDIRYIDLLAGCLNERRGRRSVSLLITCFCAFFG